MTHAFCRIGGVRDDVTPSFLGKVREFAAAFRRRSPSTRGLITDNPIFRAATRGVA